MQINEYDLPKVRLKRDGLEHPISPVHKPVSIMPATSSWRNVIAIGRALKARSRFIQLLTNQPAIRREQAMEAYVVNNLH